MKKNKCKDCKCLEHHDGGCGICYYCTSTDVNAATGILDLDKLALKTFGCIYFKEKKCKRKSR